VSSAGWVTEPGSIACGAEVPAASPVPFVPPVCSLIEHLKIFVYEMRAFSPSFTARLLGLAYQLLSNDPACPWTVQRSRQAMLRDKPVSSLSCPWHTSPRGSAVGHRFPVPPGTGAALQVNP